MFSSETFGDYRLFKRASRLWEQGVERVNGTGGDSKSSRAQRRGAQRLFANRGVDKDRAMKEGTDFTLKLTADVANVVAMHDSSEINLAGRWEPDDAGPLRSNSARGYMLHAIYLIDGDRREGRGFVCADIWRRSWDLKNNDQTRPAHRKESYKWKRGLMNALAATEAARGWVHVMDREGDVHENFEFAIAERLRVVIGARSDKRIVQGSGKLWSYMRHQPVLGHADVEMTGSRTNRREPRTLTIRAAQVTLTPAKKVPAHKKRKPVDVNVVYVRGEEREQEWMLITTCSVDDAAQAWRVFENYRLRTVGEEGFKLFKTGLAIESESVQDLDAFKRKLALLIPLATCLLEWRHRARSEPSTPAKQHVDHDTLHMLKACARRNRITMPSGAWNIGHVVECLAQLGGYERRRDALPGWLTIWRGWRTFETFRETVEFALQSRLLDRE